jgi:hypothetical protein
VHAERGIFSSHVSRRPQGGEKDQRRWIRRKFRQDDATVPDWYLPHMARRSVTRLMTVTHRIDPLVTQIKAVFAILSEQGSQSAF